MIQTKVKIAAFMLTALISFHPGRGSCADQDKTPDSSKTSSRAKVTGIGGVFFKSKDPKALAEWYQNNLGLKLEPWGGAVLRWKDDKAEDGGNTAWHVASKESKLFSSSPSDFVINYRIDNMEKMIAQLKANNVKIIKGPESAENGKFLSILDPDGNRVELWEPKIWDDKNKEK